MQWFHLQNKHCDSMQSLSCDLWWWCLSCVILMVILQFISHPLTLFMLRRSYFVFWETKGVETVSFVWGFVGLKFIVVYDTFFCLCCVLLNSVARNLLPIFKSSSAVTFLCKISGKVFLWVIFFRIQKLEGCVCMQVRDWHTGSNSFHSLGYHKKPKFY